MRPVLWSMSVWFRMTPRSRDCHFDNLLERICKDNQRLAGNHCATLEMGVQDTQPAFVINGSVLSGVTSTTQLSTTQRYRKYEFDFQSSIAWLNELLVVGNI